MIIVRPATACRAAPSGAATAAATHTPEPCETPLQLPGFPTCCRAVVPLAVPVRTPAEHPLRLHSWRLRFYSADTMFQPAPEAADAYLREVLSAAASDAASSEVPDVEALLSNQRA